LPAGANPRPPSFPDDFRLVVDRMRFQQILGNLVVNALAHSGQTDGSKSSLVHLAIAWSS
jgi:signal transduction histidine kinase